MSPESSISSEPSYEDLSSGDLGHIEVVQITFNPKETPYSSLVQHFFSIHDPTQFSHQGSDVGQQYSSVIFTHDQEQQAIAYEIKSKVEIREDYESDEVVTQIHSAKQFYVAKQDDQKYFDNNKTAKCNHKVWF